MKVTGSMATSLNHGFSCLVAVILILTFGAVFRIAEVEAALVTYPPVTYPYDNLHVQSPLRDQHGGQPHQHQNQHDENQHHESPKTATPSTNVIFFLADDQDLHLESLSYQALVKKHLVDEGLTFRHHFCTVALCCPSRVNLWTGLAAHNTNVTDVNPPYGGYPKFISQGLNERYLPVWLKNAGINTYYTGKLFNAHTVDNYNAPFAAGFTGSDFLLDPYTYSYLNSTWQRNQEKPVSYEGSHTTDVITDKANGFLNDAIAAKKPFFLTIAPVAPHSNVEFIGQDFESLSGLNVTPPISAERHKHLFRDVKIPRTAHFNPEKASGVNWIRQLIPQNDTQVEYNDEFYRSRLRALQGIDELVAGVVKTLDEHGILDNTYLIYSSDNGYHIGQHRLPPGKECGYEEDVNIPLIIRGPGIPKGVVTDQVTSHTDLAPTILDFFGLTPREDFDGATISVTGDGLERAERTRHEHVNLEYWGFAFGEGKYGFRKRDGEALFQVNNTYKAIRVISKQYNLYYSVWCNNEHELYDLSTDPYQLQNLHPSSLKAGSSFPLAKPPTILGHPISKVVARLDALLLILKSCKGASCIRPWEVLHPSGDVLDLKDALKSRYDVFYEQEQSKVSFSRCEAGYIVDAEGPQDAVVYRQGLPWSTWT